MKKSAIYILIALTLIFAAFAGGFYLGRNTGHAPVNISTLPQTPGANDSGKLNINTATVEQLISLPKIDKVLAQRIVDYRTEHGRFSYIADLMFVPGIGNETMEAIFDLVTVGG